MPVGPLFAGIGAASAAVNALTGLIRRSKGERRALLMELRGNLTLLYEALKNELPPEATARELEEETFRSLWSSNFNFAALQRRKVSRSSAAAAASLGRYVGWSTERLFETLYSRIRHLKKLVAIGFDPARVHLRRRLVNLFLLLLLLVRHLAAPSGASSSSGRPGRRADVLALVLLVGFAGASIVAGVVAPGGTRPGAPGGEHGGIEYAPRPERTVLISLDSCNAEELGPAGLGRLAVLLEQRGLLYPEARTCLAAETMSGHTSMLTGCTSAATGILGNGLYDPLTGEDIAVVQDPGYRRKATLFELLRRDHPELATAFVSGKWRLPRFLAQGADRVVASASSGLPIPAPLLARVGAPWRHFEGDMPDAFTLRAATELLKGERPFFTFVNLAWLDRIGHDCGAPNLHRRRALLHLDDLLELFLRDLRRLGLEADTLVVFTSDHGMDSVRRYLNPRRMLEEAGVPVRHLHAEGHCAFIYLENPERDLERAVTCLRGEAAVEVALPRGELGPLGLDAPRARSGDLFVSCRADTVVRLQNLSLIYPGMHGGLSSREIVLGFLGPGLRRGPVAAEPVPGIEDLAPTLLALWGMEVPADMGGKVLDVLR